MTNPIRHGNVQRVYCTYTDISGAPLDPTAITVTVASPTPPPAVYVYGTDAQVVRAASNPTQELAFGILQAGTYYIDVLFSQAGTWTVEFAASGDGASNAIATFTVT